MSTPVIELEHVRRTFPGPPEVHALADLDVHIMPGERVAIMGPSGAGKSTALNILGLLDRPSGGTVMVNGTDTRTLSDADLTRLRGRELGFVFQSFHLIPYRTVRQNVAMGLLYSLPAREITRARVDPALEAVGLAARADARCDHLSGGEAQRVAIARAIVHRPRLLLADEPTGNLDSQRSREIQNLLAALVTPDAAQIIVTHDPAVADGLDRIIQIADGVGSDDGASQALDGARA